jgi:epimerase transport system membrane fusion protein
MDQRTGQRYCTAFRRIDGNEPAQLSDVGFYPGMPARVIISTVQRTAFDHFVGRLAMSLKGTFPQG